MRAFLIAGLLALTGCSTAPTHQAGFAGSSWIFAGDAAAAAPTIEFGEGRASGHAGCNRWFGQVQVTPGEVRFHTIATTRMACAPQTMQAEARFLTILARTRDAHEDSGVLVLTDETGAELARFNRKP